jgi:hypothetical protein
LDVPMSQGSDRMLLEDSRQPVTRLELEQALRSLKAELALEKSQERIARSKAKMKSWERICAGVIGFMLITSWILCLITLTR